MKISFDWVHVTSTIYPEVSYDVKPIPAEHHIRLMMIATETKGKTGYTTEIHAGIKNLAQELFPTYMRNLKGVDVMEGDSPRPITVEELITGNATFNLVIDILMSMAKESVLNEDETKN